MSKKTLLLLGGGCIGLILLCCICFVGTTLLAPNITESMIAATATGQDKSLTRFENKEDAKKESDNLFTDMISSAKDNGDGTTTVTIAEKQMLSFFVPQNLDDEFVDEVGIKMTKNKMVIEISTKYAKEVSDLGGLETPGAPTESPEAPKTDDLKCEALEDMNLNLEEMDLFTTITFKVENEKDLVVDSLSLGSPVLDSLCEKEIEKYATENFSNALGTGAEDDSTIVIEDGKILVTSKSAATVPGGDDFDLIAPDSTYPSDYDGEFNFDDYLK